MEIEMKNDEIIGQIYAVNAPKIFLETLSARSTTLIFAITYIAFIVGFSIDINAAYKGFTSSDVILPGLSASNGLWTGTVTSLSNVISISVSVHQSNYTNHVTKNLTSINAVYDATIWACYLSEGCGDNFGIGYDNPTEWHTVVSMESKTISISSDSATGTDIAWELIPTTFQNQEAIPARGKVRSYFISINYLSNPGNLFMSSSSSSISTSTEYTVNVLTRPGYSITSGTFSIIIFFIVLGTLISFIYIMNRQKKKWLTEQKWVCYYLSALILYINPIYCVIIWQQDVSAQIVFAFYFFDAMGQAAFFVVWLLFADNISRKAVSHLQFYGPKVLIGFSIFAMTVVALVYQFPNVSPARSLNGERSPVQAVINWTPQLQLSFTAVSIAQLVLMVIWTVYWLVTLMLTGRKLRSLPYMNTRYLQLSYRFFLLQAYLLAAYFVFQYCFIIYFLLRETATGGVRSIVELTDYLNALSRQQTQLFGKVVFLTVYALVLTFLFLPASLVDNDLATALASTYVLTEKEMKRVEKSRRLAISNVSHVLAGVVQKIVDAKAEVFCVETALTFCNISFEAYYDSVGLKTVAGYDTKVMDLENYDYELIDIIYRPDHETFCVIARHKSLNKLIVCFRGTSCKQHWTDNLNYTQRELDLPDLHDLDEIDGLGDTRAKTTTPNTDVRMSNMSTPVADVQQLLEFTQPAQSSDFIYENPLGGKASTIWTLPITLSTSRDVWKRTASNLMGGNMSDGGNEVAEDDDDGYDAESDAEESYSKKYQGVPSTGIYGNFLARQFWKPGDRGQEDDPHNATRDEPEPSTMGRRVSTVAFTVAGATSNVVGGAADLVVGVAALTPGLQTLVRPQVHSGFWGAYAVVRDDLHEIVRRELKRRPAHLYFIGHSLGGALATIAALDSSIHTVPRVNDFLKRERNDARKENFTYTGTGVAGPARNSFYMPSLPDTLSWPSISRLGARRGTPSTIAESKTQVGNDNGSREINVPLSSHQPTQADDLESKLGARRNGVRKVKVTMYNFGSPRVGNGFFAHFYNRIVPDSFRTVVDGDLVTSLPPTGYRHVGTQAVVDNLGAGSIIIDPSFIERRLRTHTKSSVSVHSLLVYRKGLTGVKDAAEFMKEHAMEFQMDSDKFDAVRLALNASRNNSYSAVHSERKMKMYRKKSKKAIISAKQVVEEPVGLEKATVEVDFIPPSRGLATCRSVRFSNMDVLSMPCLSEDRALDDPIFEPLSEDSPMEKSITGYEDVCDDSTRYEPSSALHISDDDERQGKNDFDLSLATDGDEEELDYYEAAHYANDLRTTQLLVGGLHQPSIIPLDAYFRRASISVRNFSDVIMNQGQKPHVALNPTVMVSGEYATADDEAPCRL